MNKRKMIRELKHKIWMVENSDRTIFLDNMNLSKEEFLKGAKEQLKILEGQKVTAKPSQ